MFYSANTGGFYTREIHGDNIPADAVEITVEEHQALLEGQSQGKRIVADANGYPVLQDPPPWTTEELAARIRSARNRRLAECDWIVVKATEAGEAVPDVWVAYRQALRDITTQAGFPETVEWPTMPQ